MHCVIFDLDGTLLDTMEDIRHAINYALVAFDGSRISGDECRRFVGHGLRKALQNAVASHVPELRDDGEFELMYSLLMGYYRNHPSDYATPYEGVDELLSSLRDKGIKIGVLSNKRDELVKAIVKAKFPDIPFAFVQGQVDSLPLKPDKRAFDYALSAMHESADDAVYIGDSEVDFTTAENAGVARIIVSYGFRSEEELKSAGISSISHVPSYEEIEIAACEYAKKRNCHIS